MKYAEMIDLETSRLILRKLTREDIPLYHARLSGCEEVTRYMLFQPQSDISGTAAAVEKVLRRYETGRCYRWAVTLKENRELIGIIEPLRFDEKESSCSFAYMLGRDFWGRGYGTEALKAVLDFLFRRMDIRLVEADHMAENIASGAVMRKAGMVLRGVEAKKYEKDGVFHDAVCYAVTKEQWRAK